MRGRHEWRALTGLYAMPHLEMMWNRLEIQGKRPTGRGALRDRIAEVLEEGSAIRHRFDSLSKGQKVACRLAADAGEKGVPPKALYAMLGEFRERRPRECVAKLLESALLLPVRDLDGWSGNVGIGELLRGGKPTGWSLRLHPALTAVAYAVGLPGEAGSWDRPGKGITGVRTLFLGSFDFAFENLQAVLRLLVGNDRPLKRDGEPKVAVLKQLYGDGKPPSGTLTLGSWLSFAWRLGLVERDATDHQKWSLRPDGADMGSFPLNVLSDLARGVAILPPTLFVSTRGSRHTKPQPLRYAPGDYPSAGALSGRVIEALSHALDHALEPGCWFADKELQPVVSQWARMHRDDIHSDLLTARSWGNWSPYSQRWEARLGSGLLAHLLDAMTWIGLLDRGVAGKEPVARVTALGAWSLSQVQGRRPIDLHGSVEWTPKGEIRVQSAQDIELYGWACIPIARRSPGGLVVDSGSLVQSLRGGLSRSEIEIRLAAMVPGQTAPESVLRALESAAGEVPSARLHSGIAAFEMAEITQEDRRVLAELGCEVQGLFVLCPSAGVEGLLSRLHLRAEAHFDYEALPVPECWLSDDLVLEAPPHGERDLRLDRLLEEFGVDVRAEPPYRLSFDALQDNEAWSDRAAKRQVKALLRRLGDHLAEPASPAIESLLLAGAGLVAAPKIQEALVLKFAAAAAAGLECMGELRAFWQPLGRGEFLVHKEQLAGLEEELSRLGIPFPAAWSSIRETTGRLATVDRLKRALAEDETLGKTVE